MRISAIAAIGQRNELGGKNNLLWNIPEDLIRFKKLTLHHPIIMGRKTYDSIGRILPNRDNIVVTRDKSYRIEGAIVVRSVTDAISEAKKNEKNEIFIIGGGQLFKESFPLIHRLYLTSIHASFPEADVFFPDYSAFTKVIEKEDKMSSGYLYTYLTLEKA